MLAALSSMVILYQFLPKTIHGQQTGEVSSAGSASGCGKISLGGIEGDLPVENAPADGSVAYTGGVAGQEATTGQAVMDQGCENDNDCDGVSDAEDTCPGYDNNLDTDSDSVVDCFDNCPWKPNPDQTDSDGDGFGDACPEDLQQMQQN